MESKILLVLLLLMIFVNDVFAAEKIVPTNRHGVKPVVIIGDEEIENPGRLMAVIPVLSMEWSVSLNVRYPSYGGTGYTIFHMANEGVRDTSYGARIPIISRPYLTLPVTFHISSAVNGHWNHYQNFQGAAPNGTNHIEVHQRYVSNGHYRYFIMIDGVEVYSVLNTDARQFYNVHVYVGWPDPAPCFISNLEITNFL
uniref:Uncharacterized protein n=1 Tax=Clytia hemisphaerica TaxID=252671 RepID=A0A7M6DR11_9CNID